MVSRSKKGQVSFEFLMVTSVALIILTASTFFLFSYTQSTSEKSALAQVATIGYTIVDTASTMYVHGEDSFDTITANIPENVEQVYVVDGNTLVFEVSTSRGNIPVQVFSPVPINGTRQDGFKFHVNDENFVHPGRTEYVVTSMGSWVLINQTI